MSVQYDPLVQPQLLRHEIKLSPESQKTIASARYAAARILAGQDDRVLVIVGPCSIHSPSQAIEYATLLKSKMPEWSNLHIIMRAYLCVPYIASPYPCSVFSACLCAVVRCCAGDWWGCMVSRSGFVPDAPAPAMSGLQQASSPVRAATRSD